jgi:uncharacterized protein YjbI with pentapeptide repeats/stress response protein SCP2
MAYELTKGDRFNLSKEVPNFHQLAIALGWQVNQTGQKYDIDASVFMLAENGRIPEEKYFVFYNNLASLDGAVRHSGDKTSGHLDGDDETIYVDLAKINSSIQEIVFVVTIHEGQEKNQNFSQVKNAFIRLYNRETGSELVRYNLKEVFSKETALEFGRLYKKDGEWRFQAVGQGYNAGLQSFVDKYHLESQVNITPNANNVGSGSLTANENLSDDEIIRRFVARVEEQERIDALNKAQQSSTNSVENSAVNSGNLEVEAVDNLAQESQELVITGQEFEKRYQGGERDFTGIKLINANFYSPNFYGVNLSNANISQAILPAGASFTEANLTNSNLTGLNLRKANFLKANLKNANLVNANLIEANFQDANLEGAKLQQAFYNAATIFPKDFDPVKAGAYLITIDASLPKAKLAGANLSQLNLSEADLSGADLTKTNLQSTILVQANLSEANLSEANLNYANLTATNLTKANLIKANLSCAKLTTANLSGANLTQANLEGANLVAADLSNSNLKDTKLSGANFSGANLAGVKLLAVNLSSVNLSDANLSEANLCGANLTGIKLSGANLTSADLRGTNLHGANLEKANLKGANLTGVENLQNAKLTGAIMPDGTKHE